MEIIKRLAAGRRRQYSDESLGRSIEQARIGLLYEHTVGMAATGILVVCALCNIVVNWPKPSPLFWLIWSAAVFGSVAFRQWAAWKWQKIRMHPISHRQLQHWLWVLYISLLITGISWGILGFRIKDLSYDGQLITTLALAILASSALVIYAASRLAVYAAAVPSMSLLALGFFRTHTQAFTWLGDLTVLYIIFVVTIAFSLKNYVLRWLRLYAQNDRLNQELRREIEVTETAREALLASEERLRLALDASSAVIWSWDLESHLFQCDGEIESLSGCPSEQLDGHSIGCYLSLVHPEDRVNLLIKLKSVEVQDSVLDDEHRLVDATGAERWVHMRGRLTTRHTSQTMAGILCDITHKKTQDAIRRERDIHLAASQAKSLFLANVSHEIRTPLAAINGFTDSLLFSSDLPDNVRQDLEVILRNGKYLISLVSDLLDLSKIETEQLYIQRGPVCPQAEINDAIMVVNSLLEMKHLSLDLTYTTLIPQQIDSDPTRFRQILINILSNATKFTEKGGISVQVRFEDIDGDGQLKINVSDTGIGMSEETKAALFKPFSRGDEAQARNVQGSGLGLALSLNLARFLGGDLRLVKSVLGVGTEFELTICAGPTVNLTLVPASNVQAIETSSLCPLTKSQNLTGSHILVADDCGDLRQLIQRLVASSGASCETCCNGEEAISLARQKHFDMILMDIKMPVMDGYQASSILRSQGYWRPIIALTAHANANDRQRCYQAGCDDYLSKPVDFNLMLRTLAKWKAHRYSSRVVRN